jgi:hypothetical protein
LHELHVRHFHVVDSQISNVTSSISHHVIKPARWGFMKIKIKIQVYLFGTVLYIYLGLLFLNGLYA